MCSRKTIIAFRFRYEGFWFAGLTEWKLRRKGNRWMAKAKKEGWWKGFYRRRWSSLKCLKCSCVVVKVSEMNIGSFVGGKYRKYQLNESFFLLCFLMTPSDMRLNLIRRIIPIRRRHLYWFSFWDLCGFRRWPWRSHRDNLSIPSNVSYLY